MRSAKARITYKPESDVRTLDSQTPVVILDFTLIPPNGYVLVVIFIPKFLRFIKKHNGIIQRVSYLKYEISYIAVHHLHKYFSRLHEYDGNHLNVVDNIYELHVQMKNINTFIEKSWDISHSIPV